MHEYTNLQLMSRAGIGEDGRLPAAFQRLETQVNKHIPTLGVVVVYYIYVLYIHTTHTHIYIYIHIYTYIYIYIRILRNARFISSNWRPRGLSIYIGLVLVNPPENRGLFWEPLQPGSWYIEVYISAHLLIVLLNQLSAP